MKELKKCQIWGKHTMVFAMFDSFLVFPVIFEWCMKIKKLYRKEKKIK